MSNVKVSSKIKINQKFILVQLCDQSPSDDNYINGAICLNINNKEILSDHHWDLVDQLWSYLLTAMHNVESGESYSSCFPDQPLLLAMKSVCEDKVELQIGDNIHCIDQNTLFDALTIGAIHFFQEMKRLVPKHGSTWEKEIERAKQLQSE